MLTLINCAILWANAALEASWAQAELCGADATPQEAMDEANTYIISSDGKHLQMIKHQVDDLILREKEADDLDRWIAANS